MKWWVAIFIAMIWVVVPADAYAWSLVTHMQIGRTLLEQCRDVFAVHAPYVLQFPLIYLYGSVAPDRFLAKNLKDYEAHTHNWDRAFEMFRHAGTDDLRAFALGYLCHLGADVVAHNMFVPMKIMETPSMRGRRHSFWEMKFEHYQPPEAWELADEVDRKVDKALFDSFMEMFQEPSLFSFKANMRLTDRVFKVMGSQTARRFASRLEKQPTFALGEDEVRVYMDLTRESVLSVLTDREKGFATAADPRGGSRIGHARLLSKAVSRTRFEERSPRRVTRRYDPEMSRLIDDATIVLPTTPQSGRTNSEAYRRLRDNALRALERHTSKKD